jgi:hypothetical protein
VVALGLAAVILLPARGGERVEYFAHHGGAPN